MPNTRSFGGTNVTCCNHELELYTVLLQCNLQVVHIRNTCRETRHNIRVAYHIKYGMFNCDLRVAYHNTCGEIP